MKYGIDQREADEMLRIINCNNPAEDCPNCPRWLDGCEGLEEYDELLDVDCGWK